MIEDEELLEFVKKYETKDFIPDDPIQFPHRYKEKEDIEIAGFIASIFAYGKRELFINVLNKLFSQMDNKPLDFVLNCDKNIDKINGIDYRFSKNIDIQQILLILNRLYSKENSSLEKLFAYGWAQKNDVQYMLQIVTDYFYSNVTLPITKGFYHLIPNPQNNSPLKRMNMYLRWMIRGGCVDLSAWHFMPASELLMPLDVHSARISRKLNLLSRTSNDLIAVKQLTNKLKEIDPNDPTKFDFALFGYGVNNKD